MPLLTAGLSALSCRTCVRPTSWDGWVRLLDFLPCSSPTAHGALPSEPFGSRLKLISAFLSGNPTWREHSGFGRLPSTSRSCRVRCSDRFRSSPANLGRAARELARRNGATLFSTLLTAFPRRSVTLDGRDGHRRWHSGGESKQAGRARDDGLLCGRRPASGTRRARPALLRWSSSRASGINRLLRQCHSLCRTRSRTWRSADRQGIPRSLMCVLHCRIIPSRMPRCRVCRFGSECVPQARPVSISVAKSQRMARLWRWSGYFDRNCFPKLKFKNLSSLFEAVLAGVSRSPDSRTAALTI